MLLPILRHGEPYRSLDVARSPSSNSPAVRQVSQANSGLIRRDRDRKRPGKIWPRSLPAVDCHLRPRRRAFLNDTLPLGDEQQSTEDYVRRSRRHRHAAYWRVQYGEDSRCDGPVGNVLVG